MANLQLIVGSKECPIDTAVSVIRPSALIREDWTTFARKLAMTSEEIDKLKMDLRLDKITYADVIFKVLESWIGRSGCNATLGRLMQVLEEECGEMNVGDSLRDRFNLQRHTAIARLPVKPKNIPYELQELVTQAFQITFDPTSSSVARLPSSSTAVDGPSGPQVNILPVVAPQSVAQIKMENPCWDSEEYMTLKSEEYDDVNFGIERQPLLVSVTKPQGPMKFKDDHYCLRESFKGFALLLNITEFKDPKYNRKGAKEDTIYMKELWTTLGYDVTVSEVSMTSMDIETALRSFISNFEQTLSARSCVVFVGSHGRSNQILSSDLHMIDLYPDIVYKFNSSALKGIPKIFIIQSCQSFPMIHNPNSAKVNAMADPEIDDVIVCFGAFPGYVSRRSAYVGTWYIYCLTKVFMEEAHKTHLTGLLEKTQEEMRNTTPRRGQLPPFTNMGIKTLYFNMYPQS